MNKFVISAVAALVLFVPMAVQAAAAKIPYTPQAVESALGKGCAVFLEFSASW